jgi:solute carrier family 40 (iron-regulated transporter), member 1
LNAQIRRIDLLCKLLGPLFIALIDGISTDVAIITNLSMNIVSVIAEYYAIARIYHEVPDLQESKSKQDLQLPGTDRDSTWGKRSIFLRTWRLVTTLARKSASDFVFYVRHRTFLPSVAGALLYVTVLSFAGQMVTYLVSSGYTTAQIGIARTFSVAFEVLATWVAPWLIGQIGPVRAGLWFSYCQVVPLIAGLVVFWIFMSRPLLSAGSLVIGTIVSRLGLRSFDLCAQIIVQEVRKAAQDNRQTLIRGKLTHLLCLGSRGRKSWQILFYRGGLAKCI